ncbi:MAG: carboxypeptidase-like regulatory domain-containing protein, partial [Bryocella sp.]
MKRVVAVLILTALGLTVPCFAAIGSAAIRGVVRDSQGTPQMGALVELLGRDAVQVSTAFTDDHGRYLLSGVLPGQYQLRASAAFLLPILRSNLRIQTGTLAVVNLTMTTMFEAENWLPAQKRRADEPADDWKWTLRSSANRPLLRVVDTNGTSTSISTSERSVRKPVQQGRVSVLSGDGAFAQGGFHQVLLINRTVEDGDSAILRVDAGSPPQGFPLRPSLEVSAGYERRSPLGGSTRLVTSFQSHPELTYAGGSGLQVMRMASTQQLNLGDAVMIDAGTLVQAERLAATRFIAEPYLRAMVRVGDKTLVEYRYATGRELQSAEDLDHLKPPTTILTDASGRPLSQKGSHHELMLSRKFGRRTLSVSAYRDVIANSGVAGGGLLNAVSLSGMPVV